MQLAHVRTHPAVAAALARREIHLHGWVYQIDSGEVFAYDPATEQFEPITLDHQLPRPSSRGEHRLSP